MKMNCWEFHGCGRQPGGKNVHSQGVCPASIAEEVDAVHGGKNGGRCCWAIAGTFCEGAVQGSFAQKFKNCVDCEFFKLVSKEEGFKLISVVEIIRRLHEAKQLH